MRDPPAEERLFARDRVAEPPVDRDIVDEAGVGIELDFAVAHRRRDPLAVRHQPPAEAAALTSRRHRDVLDQQRVGLGDRLDQRDDALALAQKVDAMVVDCGVEVSRHRLRLAADDRNPLGVGFARQRANRRRVGRRRAAKSERFVHLRTLTRSSSAPPSRRADSLTDCLAEQALKSCVPAPPRRSRRAASRRSSR
jgi:hypothetical protein